jgi:hypothetical protein
VIGENDDYSASDLLGQLTDGSATDNSKSQSIFFKRLTKCAEGILKRRSDGEFVSGEAEDLLGLLIQFVGAATFTKPQRQQAGEWLKECEVKVSRRAATVSANATNARVTKNRAERSRNRTSKRGGSDDDGSDAMEHDSIFGGSDSEFGNRKQENSLLPHKHSEYMNVHSWNNNIFICLNLYVDLLLCFVVFRCWC